MPLPPPRTTPLPFPSASQLPTSIDADAKIALRAHSPSTAAPSMPRKPIVSGAVTKLQGDLERTKRDLAKAKDDLRGSLAQRDSLRKKIKERDEHIRELEADVERAKELEEDTWDSAEAEGHVHELEAKTKHMNEVEARVAELQQTLAARDATIADLSKQVEGKPATTAQSQDDFTEIKGIGRKFDKALKAASVTTYAQMAAWTEEDVKAIAAKIKSNPSRIQRDGWIAHAKKLAG